jgi:hypothetical protein
MQPTAASAAVVGCNRSETGTENQIKAKFPLQKIAAMLLLRINLARAGRVALIIDSHDVPGWRRAGKIRICF